MTADEGPIDQLASALEALPISVEELARRWNADPSSRVFRILTWHARELYLERTGIYLEEVDGWIRVATPEEQIRAAAKRFATATIRRRRGAEIAMGAARRAPALAGKAQRMIDRDIMREPTLANERRESEAARLRALLVAKKT